MGSPEQGPAVFRHSFTLTLRRDGTGNVTQSTEPSGTMPPMPPELRSMLAGLRARVSSSAANASGPTSNTNSATTAGVGDGAHGAVRTGQRPRPGMGGHGLFDFISAVTQGERPGQASTRVPPSPIIPTPRTPPAFLLERLAEIDRSQPRLAEMPGLPPEVAAMISQTEASAAAAAATARQPPRDDGYDSDEELDVRPPRRSGSSPSDGSTGGFSTISGTDIGSAIGADIMQFAEHLSNSGASDGAGGQPVLVQVEVHPGAPGAEGGPTGGLPPNLPQTIGALFHSLATMQVSSQLKPASSHQLDVLLDSQARIVETSEGGDAEQCPICQEHFVEGEFVVQMPCCGNQHHRACILRWLGQESGRCPVCRKSLPDAPTDPADLSDNSIAELKRRCTERNLDCSSCLEKRELVALLLQERQQQQANLASRARPIVVTGQTWGGAPGSRQQAARRARAQSTPVPSTPGSPSASSAPERQLLRWPPPSTPLGQALRARGDFLRAQYAQQEAGGPSSAVESQVPQSRPETGRVGEAPLVSAAPSSSSGAASSSSSEPANADSQAERGCKRSAPDTPIRRRITGKRPKPN